jgi:type II secretory pathway pseudopilin PulG
MEAVFGAGCSARLGERALARGDDCGNEGFSLVEVVIAMTLLFIIVLAMGAAFAGSFFASTAGRDRQVAVTMADTALDQARALNPTALLQGRLSTAVNTQWSTAPAAVDLSETNKASSTGTSNPLPTTPQAQTIDNQTYYVSWYVGTCYQPTAGGNCVQSSTGAPIQLYRVIVDVGWTASGGCASGCNYVTSTLIDAATDPYFNVNS